MAAPTGVPAAAVGASTTERPAGRRRRAVVAVGVAVVVALVGAAVVVLRPDPAPAATALELSGDLHTHDPALVAGEGDAPWYVFSTGDVREGLGSPQIRRSTDGGHTWDSIGTVWNAATRPTWVYDAVPGVSNFWAPDVYEHDGTYYLYYAASSFGSNRSVIGLTTNTTLDPQDPAYAWVDQGEVWRSVPGETNYNAIDPGIVEDADGTPWMAFGSFWGGIQMVELRWPTGMPVDRTAEPVRLAQRIGSPDAIEAPVVVPHDGWYYLFVSRDACCQGLDSTYNIAVGRSPLIAGPYVDRAGKDLTLGAAEPLLSTNGEMVGPGGQSYSRGYLAFHYYDATLGGDFQLAIRKVAWDAEGWPVLTTADEQKAAER